MEQLNNNEYNILVVEDDRPIRNLIVTTLKTHDYKYITAENGSSAILEASSHKPEIILLDLGLPDMDGVKLLKELRQWSAMPVIVVSARSTERDKILALDNGADDYITKPFNILEVKARIKAIFRRMEPKKGTTENTGILESGDMKLDRDGRRAYIQGREIGLTAKEFEVLELLMLNPDKVYSRENLLKLVWGTDYPGDVRTVDVHIRRLREKIEANPSEPKYVHTKWGVGYYFQA